MNTLTPQVARAAGPSDVDRTDARLGTVRRLYFYLVALISSTAMLASFDSLVGALAEAWLDGDPILTVSARGFLLRSISLSGAVLVVAAPIFLLHWAMIQGRLDQAQERTAGLRKFFLYLASAIAVGYLLSYGQELVGSTARLAFGDPMRSSPIFPARWANLLGTSLVAALLLYYWQQTLRDDGDLGREGGVAAVWRRLFQAGVLLVGLTMAVSGLAKVLSALILELVDWGQTTIGPSWLAARTGSGVGQVIAGLWVAHIVRLAWQELTERFPAENQSSIKRLFYYVAVVGGAIATLVPVAIVLRLFLLFLFGVDEVTRASLLRSLAVPLGYLPGGLFVWRRYWQQIKQLQALHGETPEAATIRRIYYYAVAATGLVLVWLGSVKIVQVVLDTLLTADDLKDSLIWKRPLATGLSLLAVGAPVWALHWRTVQSQARAATPDGAEERGSLPRRIYLYAVAFAGAILILYYLAQVIYHFFLYALGDTTVVLLSPELAENLARSAIAALLWLVHLLALRGDGRQAAVLNDDDAAAEKRRERQRARLVEQAETLEAELAAVRARLAEMEDGST